jgi:hypothetical protein
MAIAGDAVGTLRGLRITLISRDHAGAEADQAADGAVSPFLIGILAVVAPAIDA